MERSPIKYTEIMLLLKEALTDRINDRKVYMKGIDTSYKYEGYNTYTMNELDKWFSLRVLLPRLGSGISSN